MRIKYHMKIYIAADHGGFELKQTIINMLRSRSDLEIEDLGPNELLPEDDFPVYAQKVASSIQNNPSSKGILICRSGIGMSIVANKFKNIYAAVCTSEEQAQRAREHNDANVLCLDSEFIDPEENIKITLKFITTNFSGIERYIRRINQIKDIETST